MGELYEFDREDAFRFANDIGATTKTIGDELHFKFCPYCNGGASHDRNTFAINLKTGAFNCKRGSCERKGNMITLAQDFEQFSLGDGIDDYYLRRERYKRFMKRPIESKPTAIQYLEGRGIPEVITRSYSITTRKDNDNILVFPFYDERGDMWFIKYRNTAHTKESTGSKEWCEKERKPILFGMDHCNFENHTLVMTEGQIDSLSCSAAGIENVVSVPMGKNGFTWVPYCFNFLGRFDEIVIFGDYENGEISLLDGMKTRFKGTIKHVRPEDYGDCKDANEILMKYGEERVRQCVENAEPCPVYGLKRMVDVQRVKLAERERMLTGIDELDKKCTFIFGELIVLTGAAGDGKSTLASQWATLAINQGYSAAIYSGEMPDWMVKNWIDFQVVGARHLNDNHDIEEDVYNRVISWPAYRDNLYIYDVEDGDGDDGTGDTLFSVLLNGIKQYGIRFIIIDNLMTAMDNDGHLDINEAQTKFTKRLARIAQDHDVIIILIVHPRKSKVGGGFTNDDISGSSNIVNRAHKTIRYARPDKEFIDRDSKLWMKESLGSCPHRVLTVLKDRITGKTLTDGIVMYFEETTKRIWDGRSSTGFGWRLKWEDDLTEEEQFLNDMDDIPF